MRLSHLRGTTPLLLLLLSAALLAPGCRRKPPDPEARVRATLAKLEEAAEAGDLGELKTHLAPGYRDDHGNDRAELVRTLQLHFLRRRSIHVLTRVESIELPTPDRAQVAMLVAVAATPLPDADALARLNADLLRVELSLDADGDAWRVAHARWRRVGLGDWTR